MRSFAVVPLLLLLVACTPPEQDYCQRIGVVPGSVEYGNCTRYFFEQSALFNTDASYCAIQADQVYPRSLYDTWRHERVHGGYHGRHWHSGYTVTVPPDYRHNQLVDNLRMQIVAPCMRERGWVSPLTWEAGRAIAAKRGAATPLPWRK